jgi:hypothetical protein
MKCKNCGKPYSPDCDWRQGRCPHHPSLIPMNIQPRDTSRGHFYVSLAKSALRIVAGTCFAIAGMSNAAGWLIAAGALLVGAEILGIVEEMV